MTNNQFYSTVLLDEPLKMGSYTFHLPTRATRLDPVFILTFHLNEKDSSKSIFNISLNPDLVKQMDSLDLKRQYSFNENGSYLLDNEQFGSYFIEGEIKLPQLNTQLNEKSCFLRVTYGNREEALHYIKGNFQLTEIVN